MTLISITRSPGFFSNKALIIIGFTLVSLVFATTTSGQIDGFTEPFRIIELSSDETGAISKMLVKPGQTVAKGDVIAKLDQRLQELQLEIAEQQASASSQLNAAEEAFRKRQAISEQLKTLQSDGHASSSELMRSSMELSIAKARYLAAQEEKVVREIERNRAAVQLSRRTIVTPLAGVISEIHRHEGEFLSPLRPEVVTIVQLDRLLATFAVPSSKRKQFEIGKSFPLQLENGKTIRAKVYQIGVQNDAQSQTVEIKFVIENPKLSINSGELCTLNL